MSVINMAKTVKEIHPKTVILYKVGSFCQAFGKDAYMVSYLFGYKLSYNGRDNIPSCGFPHKALPKAMAKFENLKIDYMIIEPRNNYDVETQFENGNLNKYEDFFEKAKNYIKRKGKIDRVYEELMQIIDDQKLREKIRKIEEIIDEE